MIADRVTARSKSRPRSFFEKVNHTIIEATGTVTVLFASLWGIAGLIQHYFGIDLIALLRRKLGL